MPRMINYIRVPAVITKAQVAETGHLMDCTNVCHFEVNGVMHEPKELRFEAFSGARHEDGRFHGELLFEAGKWSKQQLADFNNIPGVRFHTETKVLPVTHDISGRELPAVAEMETLEIVSTIGDES